MFCSSKAPRGQRGLLLPRPPRPERVQVRTAPCLSAPLPNSRRPPSTGLAGGGRLRSSPSRLFIIPWVFQVPSPSSEHLAYEDASDLHSGSIRYFLVGWRCILACAGPRASPGSFSFYIFARSNIVKVPSGDKRCGCSRQTRLGPLRDDQLRPVVVGRATGPRTWIGRRRATRQRRPTWTAVGSSIFVEYFRSSIFVVLVHCGGRLRSSLG